MEYDQLSHKSATELCSGEILLVSLSLFCPDLCWNSTLNMQQYTQCKFSGLKKISIIISGIRFWLVGFTAKVIWSFSVNALVISGKLFPPHTLQQESMANTNQVLLETWLDHTLLILHRITFIHHVSCVYYCKFVVTFVRVLWMYKFKVSAVVAQIVGVSGVRTPPPPVHMSKWVVAIKET